MTFCGYRRVRVPRASLGEAEWLEQFCRPISDGKSGLPPTWKSRPLNRKVFKPLTEEEKRKALRDPARDYDPCARLEFFTREDMERRAVPTIPKTAMPIEVPTVYRATEARQKILKKLEKTLIANLRYMLRNGELMDEDISEIVREYRKIQEDPEAPFLIEQLMGEMHDPYPIYPNPDDLEKIDLASKSFTEQLTLLYNVPGYVNFETVKLHEKVKTPIVRMMHSNGEEAVISLHGGCILSWRDKLGRNRLFHHPDQVYDTVEPINRTGITFVFPNFGKSKTSLLDGFANSLLWDVKRTEIGADWLPDPAPSVTLFCKDNEKTRKIWPHHFEIYYKITLGETDDFERLKAPTSYTHRFNTKLMELRRVTAAKKALDDEKLAMQIEEKRKEMMEENGKSWRRIKDEDVLEVLRTQKMEERPIPTQLRLQFTVRNTGDTPMEFCLANRFHLKNRGIHSYRNCITILGMRTTHYLDYNILPGKPVVRQFLDDYVRLCAAERGFNGIFTESTLNDVYTCTGWDQYYESIYRMGFSDLLVFQPTMQTSGIYGPQSNMTMVGRGNVTVPIRLAPGEKWEGEHVLRHHDKIYDEPVFGYQDCNPPMDIGFILDQTERLATKEEDIRG